MGLRMRLVSQHPTYMEGKRAFGPFVPKPHAILSLMETAAG